MKAPAVTQSVLARVLLITGPETLLADQACAQAVQATTTADPAVEVTTVLADSLTEIRWAELTSGSLFGESQLVIVDELAELPAPVHPQVIEWAQDPADSVGMILIHRGQNKARSLLSSLRPARSVTLVECAAVKPWDVPKFVTAEARRLGIGINGPATAGLIDAVGHDLRALQAALIQLHADSATGEITPSLIKTYFAGRAEVTGFAIADAILERRTSDALEQLHWALATGVAPVLIIGAIGANLRRAARVRDAPPGLADAEVARLAGATPTQLRRARTQVRGWTARALANAISALALADAEVKGATAAEPGYALEKLVLNLSRPVGASG